MKTNTPGAGKKVQQLSALAASPEDGGIQFLPPRWQLTSVTPVPGIQHLLASIGTGHIHTLSHIKKKKKNWCGGAWLQFCLSEGRDKHVWDKPTLHFYLQASHT